MKCTRIQPSHSCTNNGVLFLLSGNKVIPEAEPGAQLTCQLLYRLLDRSQTSSVGPYQDDKYSCETSPDGILLSAAQEHVEVNIVLDVLKGIMKFSESESSTYRYCLILLCNFTSGILLASTCTSGIATFQTEFYFLLLLLLFRTKFYCLLQKLRSFFCF